jgi:RNA polymerase sigma-70 factor, ECF subfamily
MRHSSSPAQRVRASVSPAKLPGGHQISDEVLVERMQDGDHWAEEALYRRHVQYVAGIASRMLRNQEAADDVIQDTFVSTFENIRSVRHGGAIRVWLGRVAVSHAKKRLRHQRMLTFFGLGWEAERSTFCADPGTEGEVIAELRKLDEVVQTLPAEARIAWLLHRVEGDSLEDVAEIVGRSVATVKRRIASADSVVRRHVRLTEEP